MKAVDQWRLATFIGARRGAGASAERTYRTGLVELAVAAAPAMAPASGTTAAGVVKRVALRMVQNLGQLLARGVGCVEVSGVLNHRPCQTVRLRTTRGGLGRSHDSRPCTCCARRARRIRLTHLELMVVQNRGARAVHSVGRRPGQTGRAA